MYLLLLLIHEAEDRITAAVNAGFYGELIRIWRRLENPDEFLRFKKKIKMQPVLFQKGTGGEEYK